MALSFPLNLARFSDRLQVTGLVLHCPTPKSVSRTAGGEVMQARLGASLWQGECELTFRHQPKTGGMRALVDLLLDEQASFMLSPKDYYGPASDLGGVALGARTITLSAVAANNRDVTLAGLPPGYVLSGDDLMSWSYATNPVRHAFHRIVVGATANSGGNATVEVWPRVRPGWAVSATVELKKPMFKAVLTDRDPGASARVFHSGISFSFIQSLR